MTEQYSQTVEVTVTSKAKAMQWIGIGLVLFSLGFLMLTIFLKWYFVFVFVIALSVGVIYLHIYNSVAKEFIYDFSRTRLVVAKKDVLGKTKRLVVLLYDDVISCGLMEGLYDDSDVVACGPTHEYGVYQILYSASESEQSEQKKTFRLLFTPDTYMTALLKETLKEKFSKSERECDNE